MSDARIEAATETLTRIYADEGIVRFTLPSVAAAVLKAADEAERGLADELAAATQAMFDSMWSCNACGPHPGSRAGWCDAGCGRDANRMTPPVTDPPEPYYVTHRRVLDLLAAPSQESPLPQEGK